MRRKIWAALGSLVVGLLAGCSCLHSVDQWKCDNLGWCCFGTVPTVRQAYSPVYPSVPGEPCEPGSATPPVFMPD